MADKKKPTGFLAPVNTWLETVGEDDLIKAVIIILATGIVSGAVAYDSAANLEVPLVDVRGILQTSSAIMAVIMTILGWVLSVIVYHVAASLLRGKGNLKRMFALGGYSSLPLFGQQLLRLIYFVIFNGNPSTVRAGLLVDVILDNFTVFSLGALIVTWFALRINYGISGKKAALVALAPSLLIIGFAIILRFIFPGSLTNRLPSGLFGRL